MSSRLHPEVPALAPMVAKTVRLVGTVLCLALVAAVAMVLRAVVYAHFHGDDRPLTAVLGLLGW